MNSTDGRQPCILFLSCIGAGPKYFLELSNEFRRKHYVIPYLYNDVALLPDMFVALENELERSSLLIYHEPDWLPYLGKYREGYDRFLDKITTRVTRISIPQPCFAPFWPFHRGDPRNAVPDRTRNRYGTPVFFPYGDSYILRLLYQEIPPEEVISRYLALDVSTEVDLDRLLGQTFSLLERQDRTGTVKVADFIHEKFRSKMLFQTVNHANNRLLLYMTNRVLEQLECDTVPESVLDTITEIVERQVPVHPSIARYFGIDYLDKDTRYSIDEIRRSTFGEFVRDYVYYGDGWINYRDGLINDPMMPLSSR